MKEAHVNCVSVAIFAWAKLEPKRASTIFIWLGRVIDRLYETGFIPFWPPPPAPVPPGWPTNAREVRVGPSLHRNHMGERHNHCYTSPVYREKTRQMNLRLSKAFGSHRGDSLAHFQ